MKYLTKLLLLLLATTLFAGCIAEKKEEPVRSIEWYRQPENKAAMDAKVEECKRLHEAGQKYNKEECSKAATARALGPTDDKLPLQKEQVVPRMN
jgi:hypothetical protein